MSNFYLYLLLLAVVSICTNLNAQEKPLQESDTLKVYNVPAVVVVANKFESSIKDISTKVEIIDNEKIGNLNGNRLPDILKTSNNSYIKSYGISPSLQTISVNGLGAEHTLVLIDGVKINAFQNSQVDLSLVSKENISHIEILSNGGSSLYGSEAIGGVINIVTKRRLLSDSAKSFQMTGSYSRGSFNTNRYTAGIYNQTDKFDINLFYSSEKSDGNFDYYYNNGIEKVLQQRENSKYYLYDIGLNTQYLFDTKNKIRFMTTYAYQDKEVPGVVAGTPSPLTNQKDRNWNNILSSENVLSETISILTTVNFQNNLMNYHVAPVLNSHHKSLIYSAAPELRWKFKGNDIAAGYSLAYGSLKSNDLIKEAVRKYHSVYVSSGILLLDGVRVYPSARYDYVSDIKKEIITYKLGFNYQPFSDYNLSLKLNAGKSFRAPTFNDLYWKEWGDINLRPENSINGEFGIFYSFYLPVEGQIEAAYTFIDAKDKIVWLPQRNFIWKPKNIAESESNNISISGFLKKRFAGDASIKLDCGVNFINTKKTSQTYIGDPERGKHFPYLPLTTAKMGILIEYKIIGLNFFYSHTGRRYQDFENKTSLKPYNVLDGNINIKTGLAGIYSEIRFEVNNITNTEYETVAGYPMPQRNFLLTLSIKY